MPWLETPGEEFRFACFGPRVYLFMNHVVRQTESKTNISASIQINCLEQYLKTGGCSSHQKGVLGYKIIDVCYRAIYFVSTRYLTKNTPQTVFAAHTLPPCMASSSPQCSSHQRFTWHQWVTLPPSCLLSDWPPSPTVLFPKCLLIPVLSSLSPLLLSV